MHVLASFLGSDIFNFSWICFLVISVITLLYHLNKKYHHSLVLAVGYTLLSALYFSFKTNTFTHDNIFVNVALNIETNKFFVTAALSSIFLLLVDFEKMKPVIGWLNVLGCILTFIFAVLHVGDMSGIVENRSMNASFLVMSMPFLLFVRPYQVAISCIVLSIFFVFISSSATPAIAFLGMCFLFLFASGISAKKKLFCFIFLLFALATFTYFNQQELKGSERVEGWVSFLKYWFDNFEMWIGSGGGTFYVYGPLSQKELGYTGRPWIWAHSDVLQLFLEFGYLGVLSWGYCLLHVVRNSTRGLYLQLAAVGAFGVMVGYYPAHFPTHLLILLTVLALTLKKEKV